MSQKTATIAANVTDDEFKDYIGPEAYKLAKARQAALAGKLRSNSFAAFFLWPYWLGYHKWWSAWLFLSVVVIFVELIMTYAGFSPDTQFIVMLIIACLMGEFLSVQYVLKASKDITALKSLESDPVRLKKLLEIKGGTSKTHGVFALILFLSFAGIVNTIATSSAQTASNVDTSIVTDSSDKIILPAGSKDAVIVSLDEFVSCINKTGLIHADVDGGIVSEKKIALSVKRNFYSDAGAVPMENINLTKNENGYAIANIDASGEKKTNPEDISQAIGTLISMSGCTSENFHGAQHIQLQQPQETSVQSEPAIAQRQNNAIAQTHPTVVKTTKPDCRPYTTPDGTQSGIACKREDGTWKIKAQTIHLK